MIDLTDRPNLGPYQLTRALEPNAVAARWIALHEKDQSSHLVYRFAACPDRRAMRRFVDAVEALRKVDHPHLLSLEYFSFDVGGRPWLVTPYPGDSAGLVTLGQLLREKGGQMPADEAERAVTQTLQAVDHGRARGLINGPLSFDDVLVDRRGSVVVELYGLEHARRAPGELSPEALAEIARDEVRSIVEMAYQLITGLRAETPLIPAERLVKKLDAGWASWLRTGLSPVAGFETAGEALSSLRLTRRPVEPRPSIVNVRTVLGRFRSPTP